jgi:hypothetical protein
MTEIFAELKFKITTWELNKVSSAAPNY